MNLKITQTKLLLVVSVFFVIFFNISFFENTLRVYPFHGKSILFVISLSIILISFINILLNLVRSKHVVKPFLIILFFLSASAAYVMDSYGTVLDENMFLNVFHTDAHEIVDLLSFKLLIYLVFLWLIPSYLVLKL